MKGKESKERGGEAQMLQEMMLALGAMAVLEGEWTPEPTQGEQMTEEVTKQGEQWLEEGHAHRTYPH